MQASKNSVEPRNDTKALMRIEKEIGGRVRLYRSLVGRPYAYCDIGEEEGRPSLPIINLCIYEIDFRNWLTLFAWEREAVLLTQREVDRIVQALAGWSMREKTSDITDPELLRVIESELVVAVLLEFMNSRQMSQKNAAGYEETMERLWKELKEFGRSRGLLVRGKNHFPGGPNVLSRKLRQLAPVLAKLGIGVTTHRSNGCKVILKRLDGPAEKPSAVSSDDKPIAANDLASQDGGKAAILSILKMKQTRDRPPEPSGE